MNMKSSRRGRCDFRSINYNWFPKDFFDDPSKVNLEGNEVFNAPGCVKEVQGERKLGCKLKLLQRKLPRLNDSKILSNESSDFSHLETQNLNLESQKPNFGYTNNFSNFHSPTKQSEPCPKSVLIVANSLSSSRQKISDFVHSKNLILKKSESGVKYGSFR